MVEGRGEDTAVVVVFERVVVPALGLVRGPPTRIVIDRLTAPLVVAVSIIVEVVEVTTKTIVAVVVAIVEVPHWQQAPRRNSGLSSLPRRRLLRQRA